MAKTKTVSKLTKFYRWKYSGLIVVPGACALILFAWFSITSSFEFFETYSCYTIFDYAQDENVPNDIPTHDELTDKQHLRLHEIIKECQDNDRIFEKIKHG